MIDRSRIHQQMQDHYQAVAASGDAWISRRPSSSDVAWAASC